MIKVTCESAADLPQSLIEKYKVSLFRMKVILGDTEFFDDEIDEPKIFDFVNKTKNLPKTASIIHERYQEFFEKEVEGYDALIHVSLSSDISASYENALKASKAFKNVYVIDSKSLSSGVGIIVVNIAKMDNKHLGLDKILNSIPDLVKKSQASFILDRVNYLYKGGRCTALVLLAANAFKIHPILKLIDGKITPGSKMIGTFEATVSKYLDNIYQSNPDPDKSLCFITHTITDQKIVDEAIAYAKGLGFEEVYDMMAGTIITSHCGPNTLGILYLNK